jgi:nitrogen regulatory protein P-II 1
MRRIEAIVRPHLVDAVKTALAEVGVVGMTVSEVRGIGRQKGHAETYRGAEYTIELVSKARIEVALPDELLDAALDAVLRTAKTGKLGDGRCSSLPSTTPSASARVNTESRPCDPGRGTVAHGATVGLPALATDARPAPVARALPAPRGGRGGGAGVSRGRT